MLNTIKRIVAEINHNNTAAVAESKNNIDVVDLSKDEELKDVEQKPLTNEDKLDLLLAQMMETSVKSSEKVTQVHKQTQNVDENISQEIGGNNSGQICNTGARHNS